MAQRSKITIVGAGKVGATAAHIAAERGLGELVLVDIVPGLAAGKALDLCEAAPVELYDPKITGTTDFSKAQDSDIVIITSGLPRKPGMSRDDLLAKNAWVVRQVSEKIARYCPGSIVIVVCNPLDAMVYTAAKVTGFATGRIMGMAGVLDAARFSYFVASELGVGVGDVRTVMMGGHGDDMVALPRFTSVGGIPLPELLDADAAARLVERTVKGGVEIVNLLGYSAYYAPAAGAVKMAEAVLADKKSVFSCCAYCGGEYNVGGYFIGVPAVVGAGGIEKIIELDLNESEKNNFQKSLNHVKELVTKVDKIIK